MVSRRGPSTGGCSPAGGCASLRPWQWHACVSLGVLRLRRILLRTGCRGGVFGGGVFGGDVFGGDDHDHDACASPLCVHACRLR